MSETTYQVRKHGAVKAQTKKQAEAIIQQAKKEGYNFTQRKMGWAFLIEDQDR